jgi:transcriptional regulator with XRE-family HTH domain
MDDKWFKLQQKRVGVTAEDIAARMGRSRSNVSHILNGKQRMSVEWAKAFADVLQVPVSEVLERAGTLDAPTAQTIRPGFAESDCAAWVPGPGIGEGASVRSIAQVLGADRPGVDIWRVRSRAMQLAGFMPDDFLLVDTHAAERARAGDTVMAQVYNNATGTAVTVLRRLDPPVLMAASADPEDAKAHVVEGVNVRVRGKVVASWRV